MIWHNATPEEVITELSTDKETGLSETTASDRLHEHGKNLFIVDEDLSIWKSLATQLKKPSFIILVSLLIIFILRELVVGTNRLWIPLIALLVLAAKEAAFVYIEFRCVNMLYRLKNRINTSAKVIRGGVKKVIDADLVVPGDIIELSEGDFVPADARLIESVGLRCDEAVLYNEKEAVLVEKDHLAMHDDHRPVNERNNMVYCGCHIVTGEALAVVTETGENAEIRRYFKRDRVFSHKGVQDRIADRFSGLLKIFTIVAFVACAVITALGTFAVNGNIGWGKFLEALIIAVAFYIAVVPENLSARIACMLALGVKRLQKERVVIYNPQTVEKLAGITTICADKTGTLTQNRMVLREVFDGESTVNLTTDKITKRCEVAMRFGSLSCDVVDNEIPDHTEAALVSASARHLSISKVDFDKEFPRITSIPLTPERKIKTTVNMIEGKVFCIVRGAPDIILERCVGIDTEAVTKAYEEMCSKQMRVLAISYKILDDIPSEPSPLELEYNLEFLGFLGLADRERKGTSDEIATCREAGISTVMFTGDHINTASSVAEQMGILSGDELAVTGEQLDELSDDDLAAVVKKIKVCARFSPEQRVRFVNALHANDETVLITADSAANHAPMAIADVGCGMGKTGTDVAKGNADLVVADDRFVSIVRAIRSSRGIFANFTKYAEYYISMCSALFVAIALCMIFFGAAVFSSQLLLLGSVFTLIFPVAVLGFETADQSSMKTQPWNVGSKMFDVKRLLTACVIGVVLSLPSFFVFLINSNADSASSAALTAFMLTMLFYMLSYRSEELFYKRLFQNRFLAIMSGVCIFVTLVIAATPVGAIFGLNPMGVTAWLTSITLPLIIPVIFECKKLIKPFISK